MGEALNTVNVRSTIHVDWWTPEVYTHHWPQIEAQLDLVPHIWAAWNTKEYLRLGVETGDFKVCGAGVNGAEKCVFFARFITTPRGNGLQFFLALGNGLDQMKDVVMATFEKLVIDLGLDYCEIIGREGWLRKAPGFKTDYTVMSRQFRNFRVQ